MKNTLVVGERRLLVGLDLEIIINHDALPLIVLTKPYTKGTIFEHSIFILEKSSDEPFAFITEDFDSFEESWEFS